MNKYEELKQLVESLEGDYTKFYEKGNKSAGTRVRQGLQDVKRISQEIRMDISVAKKER